MTTQQTEYACRQCGQAVEIVGARNSRTGKGVVATVRAVCPAPLGALSRCSTCGGYSTWRQR